MYCRNVPYELCMNLELFEKVKPDHKQYICDMGDLELINIKTTTNTPRPWMNILCATFTIKKTKYKVNIEYNSSSPYALELLQIYDYTMNDSDEE